jgi:hypothetical protein
MSVEYQVLVKGDFHEHDKRDGRGETGYEHIDSALREAGARLIAWNYTFLRRLSSDSDKTPESTKADTGENDSLKLIITANFPDSVSICRFKQNLEDLGCFTDGRVIKDLDEVAE